MKRQQALLCALFMALALLTARLVVAATYPDMASYTIPSPAPTLPSGMDPYTPPVNTSTPAATAPAFAEWTRTGQPDDNLVVTGSSLSTNSGVDLGMDTNFLVYGQNSSGSALIAAKIQRLDAQKGIITLDASLPSWSMYLLWAQNSNGYGRPVGVNRTDAWWIGPDNGPVGASISVYGRNLSYQNGTTTSWIYIQQAGQAGQWVTPTAVNPYCVTFTIPSNLSTGSYLVWVHNGHGGNYGWSGPLTLTVNTGPGWTGTQFNVMSYGATGNGTTDDTAAITSCMTAAAAVPYSTIYFPAGTYSVSNMFTLPNNTRWMGAGASSTTIQCAANFSTSAYALLYGQYDAGPTNAEFDNLTLNGGAYCGNQTTLLRMRGGNNFRFANVNFISNGAAAQPFDFDNSSYIYLTDCNVTGTNCFLGSGSQMFINGVNYYGTNDADVMWIANNRTQLSISNCTGQNLNDSNPNSGAGWAMGRFYSGGQYDIYVGNNTTNNLEVRSGNSNQNAGEQLLWEGPTTYYAGTVTTATSTTATFGKASSTDLTGYEAVIVAGTGLGQHRLITGYSSDTITVSPAWNVTPDTTSQINCGYYATGIVAYNNTLQGQSDYVNRNTASAGIEPYGGCLDFIAADNNISQVRTGIFSWDICENTSGAYELDPTYFNLYTGNNISYSTNGFGIAGPFWDSSGNSTYYPGLGYFGNTFRRNTVNNLTYDSVNLTGGEAAAISPTSAAPTGVTWMETVFENNTGANMRNGFDSSTMKGLIGNTLYYKNNLAMGTGSGLYAVDFGTSGQQTPALQDDTWSGFPTTYGGTLPGAVLEVPYRNISLMEPANGTNATGTMLVWNSGTASLSWTATYTTASWLTLSAASGTISNEDGVSNVTLTCNPSGLAAGTYTSTITITGASQTETVLVTFNVGALGNQVMAPYYTPGAGSYGSAQSVAISTNTSGATIRYTTDGSIPSETQGTVYSSPVTVNTNNTTLQAIAYLSGMTDSTVTSAVYNFLCVAPSFTPVAGTYSTAQSVTISTTTVGATIRYTTDGSTPSETQGTVYSTPVSIGATATLKAMAYASGMTDSTVTSGTYTIAYSPLPNGSLSLWLKADTGVTANGSNVTQWNDQSGNGTNITSFSSSDYPTYVASGMNGLPVIRFNGTSSEMHNLLSPQPSGSYSCYIVAQGLIPQVETNQSGNNNRILSCPPVGNADYEGGLAIVCGNLGQAFSRTVETENTTVASTTPLVFYGLGGMFDQGGYNDPGEYFTGDIAEVIIYNRTLTAAENTQVLTYLDNKYNISPNGAVAAPSFTPAAGPYLSAQSVTISTTTSGATINYTTDGSTPSETAGTVYSTPLNISATTTLNAIAYESGMNDSPVTSGVYTINGTCAAPSFTPAAGSYSSAQSVTISTATSGATIMYTTNGTTPSTTVGTVYSSPVSISATTTLQAIAYESGMNNSAVTSGVYTITTCATPTYSPTAGTYAAAQYVTISTVTSGATIRYIIGTTSPTSTTGTIYSAPVAINSTSTLKAIAYETGYTNSGVSSGKYTISGTTCGNPLFTPAAGTYTAAQSVTITTATSGASIRYTTDGSTPTQLPVLCIAPRWRSAPRRR